MIVRHHIHDLEVRLLTNELRILDLLQEIDQRRNHLEAGKAQYHAPVLVPDHHGITHHHVFALVDILKIVDSVIEDHVRLQSVVVLIRALQFIVVVVKCHINEILVEDVLINVDVHHHHGIVGNTPVEVVHGIFLHVVTIRHKCKCHEKTFAVYIVVQCHLDLVHHLNQFRLQDVSHVTATQDHVVL